MRSPCHFYYWILIKSTNSVIKITRWAHGGISKIFFLDHFSSIIFRPEMLKFHPYSILTGDTRVEFVLYCVLIHSIYTQWGPSIMLHKKVLMRASCRLPCTNTYYLICNCTWPVHLMGASCNCPWEAPMAEIILWASFSNSIDVPHYSYIFINRSNKFFCSLLQSMTGCLFTLSWVDGVDYLCAKYESLKMMYSCWRMEQT